MEVSSRRQSQQIKIIESMEWKGKGLGGHGSEQGQKVKKCSSQRERRQQGHKA